MIGKIFQFATSGIVLALMAGFLYFAHQKLLELYANRPAEQYRRQLIMLAVSIAALIFAIIIMPIGNEMRGQLLGLLGILMSATIALSSTTIVGNAMAGLMLKTVRNIRPGRFITVGEYFGRVSEMDLLHVEIQTEDRNLATLPNLYLATNPVTVLRESGTVVSVEVSLGYEVSRKSADALLLDAARRTGLDSPFVQIRHLGDFSVTYRVAGIASDLGQLMSTRRKLRANTLDALHEGGIEIVSPTYMTTRELDPNQRVAPPRSFRDNEGVGGPETSVDHVVFDKARQAESVENLRESRSKLEQEYAKFETAIKQAGDDEQVTKAAEKEKQKVQDKLDRLDRIIAKAEEKIADD